MTYEQTQAKVQHKRKITRRHYELVKQSKEIAILYDSYLNKPFTYETDRQIVLQILGELQNHLIFCVGRYDKYLAFLKGV